MQTIQSSTRSLLNLAAVILTPDRVALFQAAANQHPALEHDQHQEASPHDFWPRAKLAELDTALRLSQVSRRFVVLAADLEDDLKPIIDMQCPVPLAPDSENHLRIAPRAIIGIRLTREAMARTGALVVQVLAPIDIFHPNVDPLGAVCLGNLGAGSLKHLILSTYHTLSLQAVSLDERDAAGVFNADAVSFLRLSGRIPLSTEPFLVRD